MARKVSSKPSRDDDTSGSVFRKRRVSKNKEYYKSEMEVLKAVRLIKNRNTRGPWSSSEDQALLAVVAQYQGRAWARVASELRSSYNVFRSAKQCRERYVNNLSPHIEKRPWTQDEDWAIIRGWQTLGRSWSKIARMLEGRSDNDVKNRWNTKITRNNGEHYRNILELFSDDSSSPAVIPLAAVPNPVPYSSSGSELDETVLSEISSPPLSPPTSSVPFFPPTNSTHHMPSSSPVLMVQPSQQCLQIPPLSQTAEDPQTYTAPPADYCLSESATTGCQQFQWRHMQEDRIQTEVTPYPTYVPLQTLSPTGSVPYWQPNESATTHQRSHSVPQPVTLPESQCWSSPPQPQYPQRLLSSFVVPANSSSGIRRSNSLPQNLYHHEFSPSVQYVQSEPLGQPYAQTGQAVASPILPTLAPTMVYDYPPPASSTAPMMTGTEDEIATYLSMDEVVGFVGFNQCYENLVPC